MIKKIFVVLTLSSALYAYDPAEVPEEKEASPWFTGPLIAPMGYAIPYGDFELNNYLYLDVTTGVYNGEWKAQDAPKFYSFNPQFLWFFGLTSYMDISITPQFVYNWTKGQQGGGVGDFSAGLDFQLYPADKKFWFPGIKFAVKEIFPTGKYQRLDHQKLLTDSTGQGSWASDFTLVLYKVYNLSCDYYMTFTLSAEYTMPTAVKVHGFNTYGGGFGTNGVVLPGNTLQGILSFEFNVTKNWVISLDNVWTHVDETDFCGTLGVDERGSIAVMNRPSSENLSFAPGIEYNFNEHFGIIAGCWFSAYGRNSNLFRDGVVNFYYFY